MQTELKFHLPIVLGIDCGLILKDSYCVLVHDFPFAYFHHFDLHLWVVDFAFVVEHFLLQFDNFLIEL